MDVSGLADPVLVNRGAAALAILRDAMMLGVEQLFGRVCHGEYSTPTLDSSICFVISPHRIQSNLIQ